MTDLDRLKKIMVSQDIDVSDERFVRAFRMFENPAGCAHCGARTLVGVYDTVKVKNKNVTVYRSACCKRELGA